MYTRNESYPGRVTRGAHRAVKGGDALVFQMELLEIKSGRKVLAHSTPTPAPAPAPAYKTALMPVL